MTNGRGSGGVKMKIAVNIHCLHPPLTGIGHYARHLLNILIDHSAVSELVGVSRSGWHSAEELREIIASSEGYQPKTQTAQVKPLLTAARAVLRSVPGMTQLRGHLRDTLSKYSRRKKSTSPAVNNREQFIYWEPNYLPLPIDNPVAVTLHDLSHLHYPEYHPDERLAELKVLPEVLKKAAGLITVSEFTRAELSAYLDISVDRISIVTPAVEPCFHHQSDEVCRQVRSRYGLPENFLLYVGTIEPRKNLNRLLHAFNQLPVNLQHNHPLVIVGALGWHGEEFESTLSEIDNSNIQQLGYAYSADLPGLYSAATSFVYPSLYEGFGMPILEAMACGTPVVTSNVAAMPEVAGGAAELIDPKSVDSISSGLQRVLQDSEHRKQMSMRGKKVAEGYNWHKSADDLLAVLSSFQ
jgi:glycosyltransferase involved in cell wall biosynthesis